MRAGGVAGAKYSEITHKPFFYGFVLIYRN